LPKSNRFAELDAFRGIATLIVVCYHYFFRYDFVYGHAQDIPVGWARLGGYGVHFFFMISGFVIFWSLQNNTSPKAFIVSRLSRILPAYYFALPLTFIVITTMGLPGREVTFFEFLFNFTLLQDFFYIRNVDYVYWSLGFEITFYFFITLLLVAGKINNADYWLLSSLLIGFVVYSGLLEIPYLVGKFLMIKHIGQFIAGIIFYRIYTGSANTISLFILIASAGLNYLIYPWVDATFLLSFYALFYLAIEGKLSWICNPLLLWLGSISYSLYLLHQNMGYIIIREVYALGGSGWLAIAVTFAIMLIASTLVLKLIEQPAGRWLKHYFAKNKVSS